MDSFEFNKIAGAVLTALLFVFGARTASEIIDKPRHVEKAGYTLPIPKGGPAGAIVAAGPTFDFAKDVQPLIAKASADGGKDSFKKCVSCHTIDKGGKNGTGPNLYGVIGRDIGKHEGFNYSPALKEKGGAWSWDHLAAYLHSPRTEIPGNRMAFPGVSDNAELADLLAYLRTASDAPAPLPN